MKIYRHALLASFALSAPNAYACMDILPTKSVVAQSHVVFSGTVERVTPRQPSSADDEDPQTLHVRLTKAHKGSPAALTSIKTRFCGVPHWRTGAKVLVIELPKRQYFVVKEQPLLGR